MINENEFLIKELKEDLRSLEEYIDEFSKFLPMPIGMINPPGIIIDVNKEFKNFSGYSESEIVGKKVESLFADSKKIWGIIDRTYTEGLVKNQEIFLVKKNGGKVPINISVAARKDLRGSVIGYFLAVSDLTEIKKFQEKLEKKVKERTQALENAREELENNLKETEKARHKAKEEEAKTKAALVSIDDGIILFGKDKKIKLINSSARRILNVSEEDVIGKSMPEIKDAPRIKKLYDVLGKDLKWTGRLSEIVFKEPLKRFFQVSVNPVIIEKEELIGLMIVFHDITRQKEINRMKTEFVSIAAHQLRTPLSGIKWTLKMILDGDLGKISPRQAEFLEKGYESNERMITLVNDLLSVARLEEGRFVYDKEACSLEEIINEQITQLKKVAQRKEIKLIFKKSRKDLPKIEIDRKKIELVLSNIIGNAISYTPEKGKVTISVKNDKINIKVIIEDTGIGIPEDQRERIFSKFFRADNAIKSETEGSGLGLFICKNIIEAHGGRIWFESKKGKGSTFFFALPTGKKFEKFLRKF